MPIKYKKSEKVVDRTTKQVKTNHYYIKQIKKEELFSLLNNNNTKPKVKQKLRNELARRKIQWSYVTPE
jgi:hypothetical protein